MAEEEKKRKKKSKKHKKKHNKREFSKFFACILAIGLGAVGIWATYRHYELTELAIIYQSAVAPDPALAVVYVTMVIASLLSYLLYQAGLKNSRNKYGVDENGEPFKTEPPNDGGASG